jgi:hypothetical protein
VIGNIYFVRRTDLTSIDAAGGPHQFLGRDLTMNVIDRIARDQLTDLINSDLNEQITAFTLDERLEPFRDSDDTAVQFVS